MNEWGWILAGGAAVTERHHDVLGLHPSFLVSGVELHHREMQGARRIAEAVSMYCWQNFKTSPFGMRSYMGWNVFVRPTKRVQLIAMEIVGTSGKLFWHGWSPIWIKRETRFNQQDFLMQGNNVEGGLTLTFIRGTLSLDQLLISATNNFNESQAATDNQTRPRYTVRHIFGSDGKPATPGGIDPCGESVAGGSTNVSIQNRILQWEPGDLGTCRMNHGNAVGQLALSPEAETMVKEIERWRTGEEWYKSRGIPWKRGWLLYGPPGTGKTSIVRAIAEDFDLPVHVFPPGYALRQRTSRDLAENAKRSALRCLDRRHRHSI